MSSPPSDMSSPVILSSPPPNEERENDNRESGATENATNGLFVPSSPPGSSPGGSPSTQLGSHQTNGGQPTSQASSGLRTSQQPYFSAPDSSPLAFSSSPAIPSSSLSGSMRSDRDTTRMSDRNRVNSRRGEFAMGAAANSGSGGPGSSSGMGQISSDLGSGEPARVIWGTNVSITKTSEVFKRFLSGFQQRYTAAFNNVTLPEGEGQNYVYRDLLDEMRHLGTHNLNLDARNLLEFPQTRNLYYQLINYPQEVIPIMDNALKEQLVAIVESDSVNPIAELNEIESKAYRVRPYGLPCKAGLRELNPKDIDKLVTIKGLVLRSTPVIPDMGDAFFRCAVCRHTVVVEIDRGTITEPTRCPEERCRMIGSMQLVHNRCRFNDKQVVKLQETPDTIPDGQTPHTVSLCVYDELVDYCKAGDRIEVTGVFRSAPVRANPLQRVLKSLYKTYVDVVHIQRENPKRLGLDTSTREEDNQVFTEEEIAEIEAVANREDAFDLLSRSLAPSIYENEDVKRGILLQLFGGTNKTFEKGGKPRYRGDINVLLCGDPSTSKSQMLSYVHRIAPRGIYTSGKGSSAVGLTAYVTKDTETKQLVLESGALVLSDGGVCCIDEFDKMSDATRSVLHEVMEQQTVSIAKAGIITTLNARTSILASANPIGSRYDTKLPVVQNIDLPPTLLSRFDLVYLLIDKVDQNSDRRLAKHLTSMYLEDVPENGSRQEEEVLSVEFLSKYVSYAKQNIHPQITNAAKSELVNIYVQMRSLGEDARASERRITATTRQLESLIRLSEAHAKMRLSAFVEVEDVSEAARLIRSAIKEYATDPLTGTIDMDLVQTGHSRVQREQYDVYKQHALSLLTEHQQSGLLYDELIRRISELSMDRVDHNDINAALRELQQDGSITVGARRIVRKARD